MTVSSWKQFFLRILKALQHCFKASRVATEKSKAIYQFHFWMLLLLLSRFSRVRLCVTTWMAAHQAPRPWDSPGKSTGVGRQCLCLQPVPTFPIISFSSLCHQCSGNYLF